MDVRLLPRVFAESLDPLRGPQGDGTCACGATIGQVLLLSPQDCWPPFKAFLSLGLRAMYA